MKKILVTGGTGFIGKNIVEYYENKSVEIFSPGHAELDLLNDDLVEEYLKRNSFDLVIHTANTNDMVHPDRKNEMLKTNLRMFCNLAKYSDLYDRMYYLGSGAEYDSSHYISRMKENYFGKHIPKDDYGFSKYLMAQYAAQSENIYEFVLFGVFGKYEEYRRRFISNNICRNLLYGKMIIHKNMMFDYLYITDFLKILDFYIENVPQTHRLNICRGKVFSLVEIAKIINEVMNTDAEIVIEESGWKREYSGDNTLMLENLGGFQFTKLEEGIAELVDFYKNSISELRKAFL